MVNLNPFSTNRMQRSVEKEYYEKTQKTVDAHKVKKSFTKSKRDGPEPEWWKPALYATVFGGYIAFIIFVQWICMTIGNFNPDNKLTIFHNYGLTPWYIGLGLLWVGFGFTVIKKRLYGVWYNNNVLWLDDQIQEYENDSYIRGMDHLTNEFDVAPDAGLGFKGHVSSIVSHAMISNKGIRKIAMPVYDPSVDGFVKRDKNGKIVREKVEMFDKDFAHQLFDMSNVPHEFRTFYDATDYDFNPLIPKSEGGDGKKRRGAYGRDPYDKLSDAINHSFYPIPTHTQRPAGVYFYDSRPVNTILIAITRGGKGQTYIEPAFDLWSREYEKWNLFTTDPKGELLAKFYYPMTKVGMEVIQFNLMKPELTNVFNPLINALQKFRQNDHVKGTSLIDNIVDTLFPDNGEIWNPAAGNMFRRAVYILFDYYLEQEKYIRHLGYQNNVSPEIIEAEIDKLYSKMTLYNVYSLIGELAAKVSNDIEFINVNPDAPQVSSKDLLTLLFDASSLLPYNKLRDLAITADNAIKQIADAPQTLAGIYASLLTGISVYADPTTRALMSGSISDSFDVSGMAFPRRFGVQLNKNFVAKYRLTKELARWECFRDAQFTDKYDSSDYTHEEKIPDSNWIWAYFKGLFDQEETYIRLTIESDGTIAQTFYFKFVKGYKTVNSITYLIDPITKQKIVHNGVLIELDPVTKEPTVSEFEDSVLDINTRSKRDKLMPIIVSSQSYYTERPKFIAAITPPHLQSYQRHILIIIKQIIDEIYSLSYTTKATRKPIVGTRLMLEEFGNIRSGDQGIPNIDTITSIALGQNLQITFVLQSFQQLRAVYGEDIEKIIRANSANTIFLKSNDEELINELVRLSGTRHEMRAKGYSVQRKVGDLVTVAEPSINHSMDQTETTALTSNDLLFLAGKAPGNAITFISNEMPIVNTNAHILPMAAGLHKRLPQPVTGVYSDATLPSTNTGTISENLINGEALVRARVKQAQIAMQVKKEFLDLAAELDVEIPEFSEDLADMMMNIVYERYESQSGEVRVELASTITYHEMAMKLQQDVGMIQDRSIEQSERLAAAARVNDALVRCALDPELAEYTKLYKDKPAKNAIGYDPHGVGAFIHSFVKAYPAPVKLDVSHQNVFEEAKKDPRYKGFDNNDLIFDINNSYHAEVFEEMLLDIMEGSISPEGVTLSEKPNKEYNIIISEQLVGVFKFVGDTYVVDYSKSAKEVLLLLERHQNTLIYLQNRLKEI